MIEADCHPGRGVVRKLIMCRIPFLAGLVTLASAVMLFGVAHAQVYKWVDAKGVVNYSSSPPPKGKGVVKLDEDNGRVTTIPAPEMRRGDPAAAAAETHRRWVEQCRADRRVDCDDPSRGAYVDPGYGYAYPPAYVRPRPLPSPAAPGTYQPTPYVAQGGGGAVGPYFRPPPGGIAVGPGPYGIGGGYSPAAPGGVVLAPGPAGIGAQYVPVPESAAPQPRPTPRPRPMPLQQ